MSILAAVGTQAWRQLGYEVRDDQMRMLKYLLKRLLTAIPLTFGIIFVTFVVVRMLPGNPAYRLAGSQANEAVVKAIIKKMGLDKSIWEQFVIYLKGILRGDLGISWFTSAPVQDDLLIRFPATLELITLSLLVCLIIGISLGTAAAVRPRGIFSKTSTGYGLIAGAIADFWVGLMFVYIFFYKLRWFPAPLGRLNLMITPPPHVTGMLTIDSLLAGDWDALWDSIGHLALPVITLATCFSAPIMKMTRSSVSEVLQSEFIAYARLLGLPRKRITRYAVRNALPPVVTIVGYLYGFLLGGAVLVETVFGWGGLGQYVTQAITNKDYAAIQGFMLVATVFFMLVYLTVDLIYMVIDPRIEF